MRLKNIFDKLMLFFGIKKAEDIAYERYKEKIYTLLRRGMKIGKNVTIEDSVYFDNGYPYLISIGDNCSLASNVRILCHDDTIYKFTGGYARLGIVEIKENCFIGERSIILPNVIIGPNALVAAGSVVNKIVPPNSCVAGVPARVYGKFDEMIAKHLEQISNASIYDYYQLRNKEYIDEDLRNKLIMDIKKNSCYVRGKSGRNFKEITWNINEPVSTRTQF